MTDTYARERTLTGEIVPTVEQSLPGVTVLAVELLSPSRFCVYVDRDGGVDLELCERVTRLLDDYRNDWTIDVSSPGPERPLRRPEHFDAIAGGRVRVKTATGTRLSGVVRDSTPTAVVVETTDGAHEIPYDAIVRANLIDEERKEP